MLFFFVLFCSFLPFVRSFRSFHCLIVSSFVLSFVCFFVQFSFIRLFVPSIFFLYLLFMLFLCLQGKMRMSYDSVNQIVAYDQTLSVLGTGVKQRIVRDFKNVRQNIIPKHITIFILYILLIISLLKICTRFVLKNHLTATFPYIRAEKMFHCLYEYTPRVLKML